MDLLKQTGRLGYEFPRYPVPEGETMAGFLRRRVDEGARRRYQPYHERARRQIERELALIEKLKLAGYFLIVWDIVRFAKTNGIWRRAAARPPIARSAMRSKSPPWTRSAWTCCSSASSPKSAANGLISISICPAANSANGSSSTCTSASESWARR